MVRKLFLLTAALLFLGALGLIAYYLFAVLRALAAGSRHMPRP